MTNLSYGTHTVEFSDVPPWVTPSPITVWVTNNASYSVTGAYREVTGLYVDIEPAAAATNGAGWRLLGETNYVAGGSLRTLSAGSYTVEFSPLIGWLSPGSVSVKFGSTLVVTSSRWRIICFCGMRPV